MIGWMPSAVVLSRGMSKDRLAPALRTAGLKGSGTTFAGRLEAAGVPVSVVGIKGDGHPMLRRRQLWHELSAQFVLSTVLPGYETSDSVVAPNPLRQVIEGQARITY